ncbi:hypothetical protein yc1106_01841 [Curvularia clavata]|uniref:Uncharacterized protein n=1 Tax=Curvularia clavata TaxID=95742 RepID=A0A9Q8Z2J4_CURCL|nr:hypothetical protein yc1106_01841 [Curvularia clavata]
MRFLQRNNDHEFSLVEREEEDIPRYAILSHSWEVKENEYTFQDAMDGKGKNKPGYQKIRFCMEQAARDRLEFCWIDTCCIDTSNRTELQHAMESMFRWHQNAEKCYVYLSDVSRNPSDQHYSGSTRSNSDLRNSKWFGYILNRPELLALASIEFFSCEGTYLGNQTSMAQTLEEMRDALENANPFGDMIPSQKTPKQFGQHLPFMDTWKLASTGTWAEDIHLTRSQQDQYRELGNHSSQQARREAVNYRIEFDQNMTEVTNMPLGSSSELCTSFLSNKRKQEWMDSLRFDDMDVGKRIVKNAHPHTCEWLLHTPEYVKWLDTTPENEKYWILHIKGNLGAGKSTLMKFVLSHAQEWAKGIKTISFFFTPPTNDLESSITGAYRSLSVQLLEGNLALQDVFDKLNISKPNGEQDSQWTIEALELLIEQIVRRCGPILCFIDAVDECPKDQARDMIKFFEHIHAVAGSCGTNFQVCLSSRNLSRISIKDELEMLLEAKQGHAHAISNYINDNLKIGSNKLADQIRTKLQEISPRVFLWVVLVIRVLNRKFDRSGIESVWQRLLEIPANLHKLFQDLLPIRPGEKHYFQLVLFAKRPLSPGELYSATREERHVSSWAIEDTYMDMGEHFISETSQGLIHVTNDGFRQVRFIHESVRQFLMGHLSFKSIGPDQREDQKGQCHEWLKRCCLEKIETHAVSAKSPFLEYSVSNLLFHSNAAELGGVSQRRFLETFPLTNWVKLHNLFERSEVRRYSENVSLLYLLVEYNMPELIRAYPKSPSGLEIVRERYGCPVFAAMATGNEEALKAILKGNANDYPAEFKQSEIGPQFRFLQDRDVLSYSAEFGFKGIVAFLLKNDATDVNTVDCSGRTPLMFAAQGGHEAVVKMLLETGRVDVTSKDHNGETSLTLAVKKGHRSVIQMLVDTRKIDGDVEMLYKNGQIPSKHEPWIMPLLSRRIAEINIQVSQTADYLFGQIFPERADTSDMARIHEAFPEILHNCALELLHVSESQEHRDAMAFVHRNRRSIAEHFMNVWSERHCPSQNNIDDTMSFQEKISRWNREKDESKDAKLEADLRCDETSLKGRAGHDNFHTAFNTTTTPISDKESTEDEESNRMITVPICSDIVAGNPVFEHLVTRLLRELVLVSSELNHIMAIRQSILELLPACKIISENTPAKAHTLRLLILWDPLKFFAEQLYQGKPQDVVEKVIVLTGSAQNVQAQTCAEYLSQTWPYTGKDIILLLKNVLGSGPEHRHECELPNGTKLIAWIQGSQFLVEAFGTAVSIAEVGEQFAWLGAALRSSPSESGVAYCIPSFFENDYSPPGYRTTKHSLVSFTIEYIFDEDKEQTDNAIGQCWRHLFRNPVVVTGYPIPRRPQKNTGLEIPISLMVALCQARTVTIFDGKPFIKGFCTMLVCTKHEEHVVTWHVLANEDGSHISYADPRAQSIARNDSDDIIRIFDVETSRHIVGWCASARSYAGAAEADYDIGWSGLETPYDGDRLLRKTIRSKNTIASSGSFTLGLKDIPTRHVGDQYVKRLMWIAGKFILLFDVEDDRAWMFDGASSLLHLVRASLRFSQQDDFSDQLLFKPHELEEAPATRVGKAAAIWVLTNETNKRIKLYESTECLKDRVEDILHILEQVSSYQDKAEGSDIPPQQLEGFDFNAIAMVEERIKPRITELPARGRGWVDFTKAIHAMNLFGSGFGELIRPTDNQTACSIWNKVPKGENHLAVSVSDIMRIQQREGSTKGGLLRLVDNIYWHKPDHIFESCLCVSENAEGHSDRIQLLIPKGKLGINDTALQHPGLLAPGGAVIFGHSSQNLERLGSLRRSRSTSSYQSANLTCSDSGLGSSLVSLSAAPIDSQFEAVSDTSATSNRKHSSSTSMTGHAQGEYLSAAGDLENKFSREKLTVLTETDSCKTAKKDLPPQQRNESTNPKMRNHRFTIGWISPLPLEKEAARLVMDEEYPQDDVQYDNVYYLGGRIGKHNVVIGVPTKMGLSNTAILAAKMSAGFPNIKYFLVVGVAGGVPHYGTGEIVLGDVVVSYPRRKHGGVIQYDEGAWKDSGRLEFHGHTNGIHHNLMAAINSFRAKGCFQNITQVLQQMRLKLDERRKNQYDDPGTAHDSLFADTYEHQGTRSDDCKDCCDREKVISRAKRGKAAFRLPDSPFVHFGTIASSNQLQISVAERKRLQQEHEVLCFEMEAAGVMGEYPCMVIRGICDYADSHKNKGWQNYAAATAAAYAKKKEEIGNMSGKGWWNNALSGLESRLDTILAEDGSAGAKPAVADTAAKPDSTDKAAAATDKKLAVEPASRNQSRSRPNSRLQDRLAKAVNKGSERSESRASSDLGSRPESPALRSPAIAADTSRTSIDSKASEPTAEVTSAKQDEGTKAEETKVDNPPQPAGNTAAPTKSPVETTIPPVPSVIVEQPTSTPVPTMSMPSIPSNVTPQTSSPRQSFDSIASRPSVDALVPTLTNMSKDPEELQAELSLLETTYEETVRENREELNSHLERIDALQSKLTYLSEQLAASAKAASSDAEATPMDKKLAEKDAQIAALMEEGQKLSKTEMKHMTTIKKLRSKTQEQDKEITMLKQRLAKAEKSITEQSERARRAEAAEKTSQEKLKIVSKIEKDIETIRAEREEAGLTISELRKQLNEALSRAEDAEKRVQSGALEAEKRATASLQEDIENLRIEKKLAEDRAKKELQAARDEARNQQEKAKVAELELRGEIANLESKLELLRTRTEEASSSATGDSQAKLLRQIETLQTQYSLASENWQGIETTLTSRVAALEKDRDETAKRESEVRRKAREANSKARRLEDELESINERARTLENDLNEQRTAAQKLQAKLAQAETAAQDARADLDKEKKIWEAELQQRLDEEKSKWKVESQTPSLAGDGLYLRTDSPSIAQRRHSPDPLGIHTRRANPRTTSSGMDSAFSPIDRMFDDSLRRPSSSRQAKSTSKVRTPETGTPQRQDSIPYSMASLNGLTAPPPLETPSIHTLDPENMEAFDTASSPHRTIADMLSVSTMAAGPSVQLVERMSAAVRRLESEKATHKEEVARLTAQRDEARNEVVKLMREVDEAKKQGEKVEDLEKRLADMENRELTALEMLGEKTERVEELEADVRELKRMYRELADTMK